MSRHERRERLVMNGFFANVKIDGHYKTFILEDITEDGIGVDIPMEFEFKEGDRYEVRYDIVEDNYDVFHHSKEPRVRKECVSAEGVVKNIKQIADNYNRVGFELDYLNMDEEKKILAKVKKAREIFNNRLHHPKVYLEFGFQVEEKGRDERLRNFPVFEGLLSFETHTLEFLVDADMENLFLDGDYATLKFPIPFEGKDEFVYNGNIAGNKIYNMYKNIVTVNLDPWEKDEKEWLIEFFEKYLKRNTEVLRFNI